jgi:hypothetical protein
MRLIAQSFFFLALTRVIPEISGALVSGASATGMHTVNAVRGSGMSAGAAIAGAAARAYHMPGTAADGYVKNKNAVESAVNAYSSRFEQSLAKGHSPITAGVSALGGTLWSAYQEGRQVQHTDKTAWKDAMSPIVPQTSESRPPEPRVSDPRRTTAADSADNLQDFGFKNPDIGESESGNNDGNKGQAE